MASNLRPGIGGAPISGVPISGGDFNAGTIASAVGAAAGTGAATAVGKALFKGVGSAAGTGAATAVGKSLFKGVGSAAGTGAAAAVGKSLFKGVGNAAGTGAASAVGKSLFKGVGNAAGHGVASATGKSFAASRGQAAGTGAASGVGRAASQAVGAAAGTGAASATGKALFKGIGNAAGTSTAAAVARYNAAVTGTAPGVGSGNAIGNVLLPGNKAGDIATDSELAYLERLRAQLQRIAEAEDRADLRRLRELDKQIDEYLADRDGAEGEVEDSKIPGAVSAVRPQNLNPDLKPSPKSPPSPLQSILRTPLPVRPSPHAAKIQSALKDYTAQGDKQRAEIERALAQFGKDNTHQAFAKFDVSGPSAQQLMDEHAAAQGKTSAEAVQQMLNFGKRPAHFDQTLQQFGSDQDRRKAETVKQLMAYKRGRGRVPA